MTSKHRYFAFLVYPESAPEDWLEQLKRTHGEYAISPVHQPDDDCKKQHYHVIFRYPGPATLAAATDAIPSNVPANGHVEPVTAPRNYQRYLIHLDDPDKQQWEQGQDAITVIGGFPLDLSRDFSAAELKAFRRKIFEVIRDFGIVEYSDLIDWLMDTGEVDLLDYASNHTILFNTYLTSRREKFRWSQDAE